MIMKEIKENQFVVYYRVSTKQQGVSGLGLEAQKTMCENYINNIPNAKIIYEFKEVESGKKHNRPQLTKAIELCKSTKATLVVAKLDRLSREVKFIFELRDSKIDFICTDLPEFNTLTLGIFATIAQYERELTSQRTISALAEKKKQGVKLGNPQNLINNLDVAITNSIKTKQNNALNNDNNKRAYSLIKALRTTKTKWDDIVVELDNKGFKSAKNGFINVTQARRIYTYFESNNI